MVNLQLIIFEAGGSWTNVPFIVLLFSLFESESWLRKNYQLGESSYNFIFTVVNLDPIILEKRWIDGESWPNDFVEKVNSLKTWGW